MSRSPTTPLSATSDMSNGINGGNQDVKKLHVDGHVNGNGRSDDETQRIKMKRKMSSPMLPTFMVSAPGKVIVCGEHAVVYKKASCYTYLWLSTTPKSNRKCANTN